jgi:hypothetical protein
MTTHNFINDWPALPHPEDWQDTYVTLHMWSQVIGKIRLLFSPWINHSWGVALYVTSRGLTTSPIPYKAQAFTIDFDFVHHVLRINTSMGETHAFKLEPMTVAEFYSKTMKTLLGLGIKAEIYTRPVEVVEAIHFELDDKHAGYDAHVVNRFWKALVLITQVFTDFRTRFIGKASPVHFFWGAFDLAVTRFSGRTAPKHPGGVPHCPDWVMEEAYSHELSSAGFWPGAGLGKPAFYSYAYPEPEGFRTCAIKPEAAYYSENMGEFILPYEAVQMDPNPDKIILSFLQSTYQAAADLGGWDRSALERGSSSPYDPRQG